MMLLKPAIFFLITVLLLSNNDSAQAKSDVVCPSVKSTNTSLFLEINDPNGPPFSEISGLGFSPNHKGKSGEPLLYVVNDGGGQRRFGIFDSGNGVRVKTLRLPRSVGLNLDFESMEVGSCGIDDKESTCIYIADVGDNTARNTGGIRTRNRLYNRTAYPIYRIEEPNPKKFKDNDIIPESYVTTLHVNYFHPSSPTRYSDCEAIFMDHVGWGKGGAIGDLYLVTKWSWKETKTRLFKIPARVWRQAKNNPKFIYLPQAVGDYSNGVQSNAVSGRKWTRAAMNRDGTLIVLGDTTRQYLHLRCPGQSVTEALAAKGTKNCYRWPVAYGKSQFETFAWSPDGDYGLSISECSSSESYCTPENPRIPMVYDKMDFKNAKKTCKGKPSPTPKPTAEPTPGSTPQESDCSSVLRGQEKLFAFKEPSFLCSPNGKYRFGFNDKNDLVLWKRNGNIQLWSAKSCCKQANQVFLVMQGADANIVVRGKVGSKKRSVLWSSRTANYDFAGADLSLENDGNARIRFKGKEIWSTALDSKEVGRA